MRYLGTQDYYWSCICDCLRPGRSCPYWESDLCLQPGLGSSEHADPPIGGFETSRWNIGLQVLGPRFELRRRLFAAEPTAPRLK